MRQELIMINELNGHVAEHLRLTIGGGWCLMNL